MSILYLFTEMSLHEARFEGLSGIEKEAAKTMELQSYKQRVVEREIDHVKQTKTEEKQQSLEFVESVKDEDISIELPTRSKRKASKYVKEWLSEFTRLLFACTGYLGTTF